MEAEQDFLLPSLAHHLKLSRAPDEKGEPYYTLHNSHSNSYFKIDWIAFECISRIFYHKTALELKNAIESETTLKITTIEIKNIIDFLGKNGLLSLVDQKNLFYRKEEKSIWNKIFHHYLFFSIPLFKPQQFLEKTYPYIRWIHHSLFLKMALAFLMLMLLLTLPRVDEFIHTFGKLFSAQGAIATLLTFTFVKIIHEFAHAYTAIKHGVKVPHMGIAFILMYPVLYTETTGSWILPSRRARFEIGIAGIISELLLAGIFLMLWHISPSGSLLQSICFLVVSISLIGSLLVNLNPFMRFDGYYLLSDATGFDNLQTRSCQFARHRLRNILFGWNDPLPEVLPKNDVEFLTNFGFLLLIYRFFLFVGISILIYHLFFQPLGFILMMIELGWFIFLPILSEFKIWWKERDRILSSKRVLIPISFIFFILLCIFLPLKTNVILPAVVHAGLYDVVYAPFPSQVVSLNVAEGELVEKDQILIELQSPELEYNIKKAQIELNILETLRRRERSMIGSRQTDELSDDAIEKARLKVKSYEKEKAYLTIKSPFKGKIRDLGSDITQGRYVGNRDALFKVVNMESTTVSAYANESEREKINNTSRAIFYSEYKTLKVQNLNIIRISDTGTTDVIWPELASSYGGDIPTDQDSDRALNSRRALYEVVATSPTKAPHRIERGYLKVETSATSLFLIGINKIVSIFRREGKI